MNEKNEKDMDRDEEINDLFNAFDTDNDGFINYNDYLEIMKLLGLRPTLNPSDSRIQLKDLKINYKNDNKELDLIEELKEAFKILDRNQNNYLEAQDFKLFMSCLGDDISIEDSENFINLVSNSNKLTFDNFLFIMRNDYHIFSNLENN